MFVWGFKWRTAHPTCQDHRQLTVTSAARGCRAFGPKHAACAPHQERCRLLTLLPPSVTRKESQGLKPKNINFRLGLRLPFPVDIGVVSGFYGFNF